MYGLPPNPGRRWRDRRGRAWSGRYTIGVNEDFVLRCVLRWLALPSVPALVVSPPADHLAEIRQARESNEASETVVPTTFVDDAELVWALTEKFTQEETAKAMGWSRPQVSQYAMLNKIDSEAWAVIATSFKEPVATAENDVVAEFATTVATPFTEGLLRNILDLSAAQQTRLCKWLVKGKDPKGHAFGKADFKTKAGWFRGGNALRAVM